MQLVPLMIILDYKTGKFIHHTAVPDNVHKNQIITLQPSGFPLGEVCPYYKIKSIESIPNSSDIKIYIEPLKKKLLIQDFYFQ